MSAGRKGVRDKVVWLAGLIGAVVIAVWVLPRVASYRDVAAAIAALSSVEIVSLFALGLVTIAVAGWSAQVALPGLTWPHATQSTLCANFLTALVPTGADLAVRFAMYRSWGFGSARVTAAIAMAGLGRYFTLLSLPLLGMSAVLIAGRGDEKTALRLVIGLVVFALLIAVPWLLLRREGLAHRFADRLEWTAQRIAGLLRRPTPEGVADRVLRAHGLIVSQARSRGLMVTVSQLAASLANAVVLLAAVRFVGVSSDMLSWTEVLYAFALGTIAGVVPLTPGNIGVTELILLGVLGLGAANLQGPILAAALLYRIFTWMLPIPLGVASFLWWRLGQVPRKKAPQ